MDQQGFIQVIYGPMFSGKSSQLMRKIRRYQHAKKKCLIINYLHDNRYTQGNQIATHDKITKEATKTKSLMQLVELCLKYDVIGIDQGQFFQEIVQFSEFMANKGKIVIVAALDGTFQRNSFNNIVNLIPKAEKVIKLNAICVYCAREAAFTKRLIECKQIQLIGGQQIYQPVCRNCYFKQQKKITQNNPIKQKTEANIKNESQQVATVNN